LTAYVLITGTVFRGPEQRTSKNGKPFVTATLLAKDGEARSFWNVVAFSESAIAELTRLCEGEKIAVQGSLQIGEYEKDGKPRVSLGLTADHVLALRQWRSSEAWRPEKGSIPGRCPNRGLVAAVKFDSPHGGGDPGANLGSLPRDKTQA